MKRLLYILPFSIIFLSGCQPPPPSQAGVQQNVPPTTQQSDCLVETIVGFNQHITVDQQLTAHCKQRIAEGWHLVSTGNGSFIWIK